jgi:hypothetical protein
VRWDQKNIVILSETKEPKLVDKATFSAAPMLRLPRFAQDDSSLPLHLTAVPPYRRTADVISNDLNLAS